MKISVFLIFLLLFINFKAIHSFQPLGPDEIRNAVRLLRDIFNDSIRIIYIVLKEPEKTLFYNWPDQPPPDREATAILFDSDANQASTVTISLTQDLITDVMTQPDGTQPMITVDEAVEAKEMVKSNVLVKEMFNLLYGVKNTADIQMEIWSYGYYASEDNSTSRLARMVFFLWDDPTKNNYAKPITGIQAIVDLGLMQVLQCLH